MTAEPLDVVVLACAFALLSFIAVDWTWKRGLRLVRFIRARHNARKEIRTAAARREPAHTVTRMARPTEVLRGGGHVLHAVGGAAVVDRFARRSGEAVPRLAYLDPDSCYSTTSLRAPDLKVRVKPFLADYEGGDCA